MTLWSGHSSRYAVSAVTALALAGGLAAIPRDECGASVSGACIDVGAFPMASKARIGESGEVAQGRLAVDGVRAARTVVGEDLGDEVSHDSPPETQWIVVDVTGTVVDKPRRISVVLGSGRRFWSADGDVGLVDPNGRPGMPTSGRFAFQVPDQAAQDGLTAYLRFGKGTPVAVPLGRPQVAESIVLKEDS